MSASDGPVKLQPRKVQSKRIEITDEIRQAVLAQLDRGVYYGGEQAYRFEHELAAYLGVQHVLTVNSGTSAILVAAMALGIGPGDEVVVPANVYVSSAEVPAFLGAVPVFCDVDEATANMTAETLRARLSPRTKAVIVTHMYGHAADMDPILDLARSRGVRVIEICAHGLGAEYNGRKLGTFGDAAVFSLGSKNISMCATGGAVATNSADLYGEAAKVSRHGWARLSVSPAFYRQIAFADSPMSGMSPLDRDSTRPGLNLQLDEIPCAIGRIGLRHLEAWNTRRREIAALYTRLLTDSGVPVRPPIVHPWTKHAFLHYVIRAPRRDGLRDFLVETGVEALIHYPQPLPDMRYYRDHYPTNPTLYPVASRAAGEILTLPIHPWLGDADVEYVVGRISQFYRD